jgi:hypothetical protein
METCWAATAPQARSHAHNNAAMKDFVVIVPPGKCYGPHYKARLAGAAEPVTPADERGL